MKRLLTAALILSMLGGSAAIAAPYNNDRGYSSQRHGDGNDNAVIAGVGILALAAIFASQNHGQAGYGYQNHYRSHYGNDQRDYRGGYDNRGQDRDDNDRQSGYGRR